MIEVGQRVALNKATLDTENQPVYANEVGYVVGHVGPLIDERVIVALDHGQNSKGERRIATVPNNLLRVVRVSHPGKARRSRPRRNTGG